MGRRAYITRLALGRSAYEEPDPCIGQVDDLFQRRANATHFEPGNSSQLADGAQSYVQQHDERGHPTNYASRAMARSLIRAQNDVLATVGVVVGPPGSRKAKGVDDIASAMENDKKHSTAVEAENKLGLMLLHLNFTALLLATWWTYGMRIRLQMFRTFAEIPLLDSIKLLKQQLGVRALLFAGFPAHIAAQFLLESKEYIISLLCYSVYTVITFREPDRTRRRRWAQSLHVAERMLARVTNVFIAPLNIFSLLQVLNLIPASQLLPPLVSLIPFSSSSPFQLPNLPKTYTLNTIKILVISVLASPFLAWYAYNELETGVEAWLRRMIRNTLPTLGKADTSSAKGAVLYGPDRIPNMRRNLMARNDDLGFKQILQLWTEKFQSVKDWVLGRIYLEIKSRTTGAVEAALVEGHGEGHRAALEARSSEARLTRPEGSQAVAAGQAQQQASSDSAHEASSQPAANGSFNNPRMGTNAEDAASVQQSTSRAGHPYRESGTTSGTSTPEHNPANSPGLSPPATSPRVRSPQPQPLAKETVHRITALSLYPINSASNHLSAILTGFILSPFQAAFARTIVASFLNAANAAESRTHTALLRQQLCLPLVQRGPHGFSLTRYLLGFCSPGKTCLRVLECMAMEMVVNFLVYEVGFMAVIWYGKRCSGWGNLSTLKLR